MTPKAGSQKKGGQGSKGKKKASKRRSKEAAKDEKKPEEGAVEVEVEEEEVKEESTASSLPSPLPPAPIVEKVVKKPLEIKHPLRNSWTLWYFKFNKSKDWSESLIEVCTFKTIEDFWALFKYLQPVSTLSGGSDYSLFKTGITPMWEDVENRQGGRWIIKSERLNRGNVLDHMWLEMLLFLIGGDEEWADEISGGYVNVRQKFDKISLWMRNRSKKSVLMKTGAMFKERLGVDRRIKVEFEFHEDSCNRSSSNAVYRFVV